MKKNMGTLDRSLRITVAIILITLYFTNILVDFWGILALIVAGIFLLTSAVGNCPLYSIFGISSCSLKEKKK